MKVIKPQKLAVLHRPYERAGRYHLAVTVGIFFRFDAPDVLLPETTMWKFAAEALGADAMLDAGMPKQRGEVLVKGSCFTPGGKPLAGTIVRIKVGAVDKTLQVLGDRFWTRRLASVKTVEPVPFTEMEVTWARAFGGAGFAANPLGKGAVPIQSPNGESIHPLPNIEDPKHPIASTDDRPAPAGFEPIDLTWPQRFSKMGTYDDDWFKSRFPNPASDLDWSFHNTASPDQWLDGFFKGGEDIEVTNMHKSKPLLKTRLPRVTARTFINQRVAGKEEFRELKTVAETVWLFPNAERGILLFRSIREILTDDGFDVLQLVAAAESPDSPRDIEHYKTVLAKRLDRKEAPKWLLREDLLLPPETDASKLPADEVDPMLALVTPKLVPFKRMRAKVEKDRAELRASLESMNSRTAEIANKKVTDLAEFDKQTAALLAGFPVEGKVPEVDIEALKKQAAEHQREADALRANAEKNIREKLKAEGITKNPLAEPPKRMPGPPEGPQDPQQMLRQAREQAVKAGADTAAFDKALANPELAELTELPEKLGGGYQRDAHHYPEPGPIAPAKSAALRTRVVQGIERRESMAGLDFSGADLSKMKLAGTNLNAAYLEAVNLSDSDLSGANLAGVTLARGILKGAKLAGANLANANLGKADLSGADLRQADLSNIILFEAILKHANLANAKLVKPDLFHAQLEAADLSGTDLPEALFLDSNLDGVNFSGTNLTKAQFLNCSMNRINFTGANLNSAVFLNCKATDAKFHRAELHNLRMVQESSFPGADFSETNLAESCLRGSSLQGANFEKSVLTAADLSEANLCKANFSGVSARGLRLIRADLTEAKLSGSDLMEAVAQNAMAPSADFRDSNLYRADVLKITIDPKTNFSGSNLKRTLLRDWKPN